MGLRCESLLVFVNDDFVFLFRHPSASSELSKVWKIVKNINEAELL
jgi:hypothetical protein